MNNVNSSVGNTSVGEEEYTLSGKSTIMETLRGLTFQISANSFFQTNTHQVCPLSYACFVLYSLIPFSRLLICNSKGKGLHCLGRGSV